MTRDTETPFHQSYGPNPYGVAAIPSAFKNRQTYDIAVALTLPRSPRNLARGGNFMVAFELLGEPSALSSFASAAAAAEQTQPPESALKMSPDLHRTALVADRPVLHFSARPALMPYADPVASLAWRVLFLPYHVLFSSRSAGAADA